MVGALCAGTIGYLPDNTYSSVDTNTGMFYGTDPGYVIYTPTLPGFIKGGSDSDSEGKRLNESDGLEDTSSIQGEHDPSPCFTPTSPRQDPIQLDVDVERLASDFFLASSWILSPKLSKTVFSIVEKYQALTELQRSAFERRISADKSGHLFNLWKSCIENKLYSTKEVTEITAEIIRRIKNDFGKKYRSSIGEEVDSHMKELTGRLLRQTDTNLPATLYEDVKNCLFRRKIYCIPYGDLKIGRKRWWAMKARWAKNYTDQDLKVNINDCLRFIANPSLRVASKV